MNTKVLPSFALVFFLLLSLSVISMPKLAFCQGSIARQTILVQSDGSIYPSNAPIQTNDNTYTLTQDSYDPILIQKSSIVFDGAGYSLIGPLNETQRKAEQVIGVGPGNETQVPYIIGIDIDDGISEVTIKNLEVRNFSIGAYIHSRGNALQGSNIHDNIVGVLLSGSANSITYNYIAGNEQGLFFGFEDVDGIGNIPSDILISHNSFVENTRQLSGCVCKEYNLTEKQHSWDNGKEGNYWSDYNGTDANRDGIGDTAYVIDPLNQDRYPLMVNPLSQGISIFTIALIAVVIVIVVTTVIGAWSFKRKRKQS
ncbi:MAG: hypothetical protein ACM3WQ_02155 [Chloroflexota bacterium]